MAEAPDRVKLRATLTIVYEAVPDAYGTSDPDEMAEIDRQSLVDSPDFFVEMIHETYWDLKVEVVNEE